MNSTSYHHLIWSIGLRNLSVSSELTYKLMSLMHGVYCHWVSMSITTAGLFVCYIDNDQNPTTSFVLESSINGQT